VHNDKRTEISAYQLEFLPNMQAYKILTDIRKQVLNLVTNFYGETNKVWNEFTLLCNLHDNDCHYLHADNEVQDADSGIGFPTIPIGETIPESFT
jgi:hypothetical protein